MSDKNKNERTYDEKENLSSGNEFSPESLSTGMPLVNSDSKESNTTTPSSEQDNSNTKPFNHKTGMIAFFVFLGVNLIITLISVVYVFYEKLADRVIYIISINNNLILVISSLILYGVIITYISIQISRRNFSFKKVLRLRQPKYKSIYLYTALVPTGFHLAIFSFLFGVLMLAVPYLTRGLSPYQDILNQYTGVFIATSPANYIFLVFLLAISPGIFEELAFRGFILSSYLKTQSIKKSVVLTSLFFGILHLSPANVIGTFGIGLLIAYLLIKSKSLFPAIMVHILHNFYLITGLSILYRLFRYRSTFVYNPDLRVPFLIIAFIGLHIGVLVLIFSIIKVRKYNDGEAINTNYKKHTMFDPV
jgi:uncharacterized protein